MRWNICLKVTFTCSKWTEMSKSAASVHRVCKLLETLLNASHSSGLSLLDPESYLGFAGPVQGKISLVILDVFTKWLEVYRMPNDKISETVSKLSTLFRCFGVLETSVTENCSQFISDSFRHFCNMNRVTRLYSLSYHPISQGQAGCFVDNFKRALMKGGQGDN